MKNCITRATARTAATMAISVTTNHILPSTGEHNTRIASHYLAKCTNLMRVVVDILACKVPYLERTLLWHWWW
jgi:hypothetical protein